MRIMFPSVRITALALSLCLQAGASVVSQDSSLLAAQNFFQQAATYMKSQDSTLDTLNVSNLTIQNILVHKGANGQPTFYTVNFSPQGWVHISAEDNAVPVLGYSLTGQASPTDSNALGSEGFQDILAQYSNLIDSVRVANPDNAVTKTLWQTLLAGTVAVQDSMAVAAGPVTADFNPAASTISVYPLLQSTWDQNFPYNQYAPTAASGPGGHAWAGCTAVSTSQVMKYYSYPTTGVGTRNGVDFTAKNYDFGAMPLNAGNANVARLMRDVGAAVDMSYSGSGSAAYTSSVANALKTYFLYSPSLSYQQAAYSTPSAWSQNIKTELDAGRPVIYEGFGTGGHSFVLDGYTTAGYFHMNFGWSGYANGYYSLADITPGSDNFTNSQGAIFGIKPAAYTPSQGQVLAAASASGQVFITGDLLTWVGYSAPTVWTKMTSLLSSVNVADLNGDGKMNELVGIGRDGYLYETSNLSTWSKIRAGIKQVIPCDLDGNGKMNDLVILDTKGVVWYSIAGGTFTQIPGVVAQDIMAIDLNKSGKMTGILAANYTAKKFYTTANHSTWSSAYVVPNGVSKIQVWDANHGGFNNGLLAQTSTGVLSKSVDFITWTKMSKTLVQLIPTDLNKAGSNVNLVGRSSAGLIFTLTDTTWNVVPGPALANIAVGDFDGDGKMNDIAGNTSANAVYVSIAQGSWYHLNGAYSGLVAMDAQGKGHLQDLVGINSSFYPYYTTNVASTWIGTVQSMISLDHNRTGKLADLAVLDNFGTLFYTEGSESWSQVSIPEPLYRVIPADLTGSGYNDGLVAIGLTTRSVYTSSDLTTWKKLATKSKIEWVAMGDLKRSGKRSGIVATGTDGSVWTSPKADTLLKIAGTYQKVVAMDVNHDGFEDDLLAIKAADMSLWSSMGASGTWSTLTTPTSYAKDIVPYDAVGTGVKQALAVINKTSIVSTSADLKNWTVQGKAATSLWMADLDNTGKTQDMVIMGTDAKLWLRKASASDWSYVSSSYKTVAVGNFSQQINSSGSLNAQSTEAASVKSVDNVSAIGRANTLQLQMRGGQQVEIATAANSGEVQVLWVKANGQTQTLYTGNAGTGGRVLVDLTPTAHGFGYIVVRDTQGRMGRLGVMR